MSAPKAEVDKCVASVTDEDLPSKLSSITPIIIYQCKELKSEIKVLTSIFEANKVEIMNNRNTLLEKNEEILREVVKTAFPFQH